MAYRRAQNEGARKTAENQLKPFHAARIGEFLAVYRICYSLERGLTPILSIFPNEKCHYVFY